MKIFIWKPYKTPIVDAPALGEYSFIRAHYMSLTLLADVLGAEDIVEFTNEESKYPRVEGSELSFTKYSFNPCNESNPGDLLVIMHHQYSKERMSEILQISNRFSNIAYYCSDPEYSAANEIDPPYFSRYLSENKNDPAVLTILNKLRVIFCGLAYVLRPLSSRFDIPIVYLPQLINPDIKIEPSFKFYDAFVLDNCLGMNRLANKVANGGNSVLNFYKYPNLFIDNKVVTNTKDESWSSTYIDYIRMISQCKYFVGTNSGIGRYDQYKSFEVFNHHSYCSRYLESYYANTIPVPAAYNEELTAKIIKDDLGDLASFKEWMERNFMPDLFINSINQVKLCLTRF